jgi:hypothetical protein
LFSRYKRKCFYEKGAGSNFYDLYNRREEKIKDVNGKAKAKDAYVI